MSNIQARLVKLEGRIPSGLIILIELADGTTVEGSVSDLERLHSQGASFKRVVSGTSITDVDRILEVIIPANGVI